MNARQFLHVLGIQEQDVLNMYIYGSRLFEPSRVGDDTDYDLLIVVKSSCPRWKSVQSLHRKNLDATILTDEEFGERIKTGCVLEWALLLIPDSHIIPQKFRPKVGAVSLELLRTSTLERYQRDKAKATKFKDKGKEAEALKIWNHAYRNFKLARQIIQHGTITQFEGLTQVSNAESVCQLEAVDFARIQVKRK